MIGQVGAWSNPISLVDKIRKQGLERNIQGLQLADEIDALCCVYASGSLGKQLKSSHLKDVKMHSQVTAHIDEVRIGTGNLDIATFLREMATLKDVPILIEHMHSEAEYRQATDYTRGIAAQTGINL